MNFDQPQRFPAHMTALPELQSLVAAACEQAALELLAANRVRWAKLFRRDGVNKTYEKLRDQGGAQI